MKALIHVNAMEHQRAHAAAMAAGLIRHGVEVRYGTWDVPEPCDVAVVWGAKQSRVFAAGRPVLVMERGHLPDRMLMTSVGWGDLGRRGRYPTAPDGGARWQARYAGLMQPWATRQGYALIIGQVPGDAALRGLDIAAWVEQVAATLGARGWTVRFRPHPLAARPGAPLAEDLAGAAIAVTFNSTAGVEAVLAGVPTVTLDAGAMAWPVAAHALSDPPTRPAREAWAWDLAWTQWSVEEIATGEAWAHVGPVMPGLV